MVQPGMYPPPGPSTPRVAPWDAVQELCNRLDKLVTLLEKTSPPTQWPGWEPVISKLDEIKTQLSELEIKTTWEAKDAEEIFRASIRAAGTYHTEKMVNWTKGKRLVLRVDSSLDQAVQVQAVGNVRDALDGAVDINGIFACVAGGKITIGFAWDDWHPYIGASITVLAAPTSGELKVEAVVQE